MRFIKTMSAMSLAAVVGTTACSNDRSVLEPQASIQGGAASMALVTGTTLQQTKTNPPSKVCSTLSGGPYTQVGPFIAAGDYAYGDGTISVMLSDQNATGYQTVSWTTNFTSPTPALVLVHGGSAYTVINPGVMSGSTKAPINSSGGPANFSNIVFCFKGAGPVAKPLTVGVSGSPAYTRTHSWSINKLPQEDSKFVGDDAGITLTWTVTANSTSLDSDFQISGTVTIANSSVISGYITGAGVSIDSGTPVACTGYTTPLVGGGSTSCTFSASVAAAGTHTLDASVTTSGTVAGGTASNTVVFGDPTTVVDASAAITDSYQGGTASSLGTANAGTPFSATYTTDIPANTECASYEVKNIATFTTNTTSTTGNAEAVVAIGAPADCGVIIDPPTDPVYEDAGTGYAKNGTCFATGSWGWGGALASGTYNLIVGAGGPPGTCQSAGIVAGTVTVTLDGQGGGTVTYTLNAPYSANQFHLNITSALQTDRGAPGQYTYTTGIVANNTTTKTFTLSGLTGGEFFAAHAHVMKKIN